MAAELFGVWDCRNDRRVIGDGCTPERHSTAAEAKSCMHDSRQKATPGINRVKVGAHIGTNFFLTNGPSQSHGEKWLRPYVEYLVFERGRWGNIRFGADRVGKAGHYSYEFWTALGGVYGAGEPGPNDWRTNEISKKWKTRCGVYANGLFV